MLRLRTGYDGTYNKCLTPKVNIVYIRLYMDFLGQFEIAPMKPSKVWTVAEAKARLSEVLRLADDEGPQRIGARKSFMVVPEHVWKAMTDNDRPSMGQWLVNRMPRGEELPIPSRAEMGRAIPFTDEREQ